MTTTAAPMCMSCKHLTALPEKVGEPARCNAFPDGIPDAIFWESRIDHRKPWAGDGGTRFEQDPNKEPFDFTGFEEVRGQPGPLRP